MIYTTCFVIAILFLIAGILLAKRPGKGSGSVLIRPRNWMIMGVFASATSLFIPIYAQVFSGSFSGLKTLLISFHNAIRLFIVDGEFNIIQDSITKDVGGIWVPYSILAAILYVLAPILTFSLILSLIRNAHAYITYLFAYFKDVYIFSELNDESIALAKSLKANHKHAAIVYTDVFETNDEKSYELMQKVRRLMGITFKSDVELINFRVHSKNRKLTFILIGHDEAENIRQSMTLIDKYKGREHTELYVFSDMPEGELLISGMDKGNIKVRRINGTSTLINRYLYEHGTALFDEAIEGANARHINALILGVGRYGKEMLRALPWFCQMDGYRVYIDAYDAQKDMAEKFEADYPELMSAEHNGAFDPEDAEYEIALHPGMDADTVTFINSLTERIILGDCRDTTFAFVATGDDNENVRIATKLRTFFERKGIHPRIVTIVQNSHVNKGLKDIRNYSGQPYDIQFIGSMEEVYSEESVTNSELEQDALSRHLRWGNEEDFWRYEYNYRSSVATTLHARVKKHCQMPGLDKREEELTPEERAALERLEHRRWNAYMRAEGYVFSGSKDPASRNDLGKMHHDLIPYKYLSEEEKRKDSKVTTF